MCSRSSRPRGTPSIKESSKIALSQPANLEYHPWLLDVSSSDEQQHED